MLNAFRHQRTIDDLPVNVVAGSSHVLNAFRHQRTIDTVPPADIGVEAAGCSTPFGINEQSGFGSYTYARGVKKKIELRPLDARMSLPEGEFSYLLEEFSQYFCVEQAFGQAQQAFEKVLGQKVPVDSLERISRRLATEAKTFLEQLPTPAAKEEGELLVLTADGKGVPMIRENVEPVVPFAQGGERRGNRQMATVAAVYSVDPYPRTPEEVVAALFREGPRPKRSDRPKPCHKRMVARFARIYEDGEGTITVPGSFEALSWAAEEVRKRRQAGQTLLRLGDGQEDLWQVGQTCLEEQYVNVIDILDILQRKIKPFQILPCVVIGYTSSRRGIRSLLVAAAWQGKLQYVAELTAGFTDEAKVQLRRATSSPSSTVPLGRQRSVSSSGYVLAVFG